MAVFALEANGAANESVVSNRQQQRAIRRFITSILPKFRRSSVESSPVVFIPFAGSQFRSTRSLCRVSSYHLVAHLRLELTLGSAKQFQVNGHVCQAPWRAARATYFGGQQNVKTVSKVTSGSDLGNGVVDVQTGVAPTNIRALPNRTGMLALDLLNIDVVMLTNPPAPFVRCPPTLSGSESVAPQNLGQGSPTVNQFLVTPNSSTAVLTGNVILVNLANPQSLQASSATLQNSAALQDSTTGLLFKGDVAADSSTFVVGGNDGNLHEIPVSSGADNVVTLSGLGLTTTAGTATRPNLVAVQNH